MATSWNIPALVNKILSDLPGIRTLLQSLAKMDYTGTTDIPTGAVCMAQVEGGYQLQRYNGTSWVSVGKLIHDADSVDGKSASTSTTANTIPVRDSSGKIAGDITGNAATATSAAALSTTLAIGKGGTGATSASAARSNLGVPPTSHASSGTTYGLASATVYGHSMATSEAPEQDTDAGSVGTDVTHFARADHAHKKVLGTSTVYGQVKLTDSVSSTSAASSHIGASAKAVKTAYDKASAIMIGSTASEPGKSGNVPVPQAGQQNSLLTGAGVFTSRPTIKYLTVESEDDSTDEGGEIKLAAPKLSPESYSTIIDNRSNITRIFAQLHDGPGHGVFEFNHDTMKINCSVTGTSNMPIGYIYIQISGTNAPSDLFGGVWTNVSNSFAGAFLRIEGGNAAPFGSAQDCASPNIYGIVDFVDRRTHFNCAGAFFATSTSVGTYSSTTGDRTSEALGISANRSSPYYGAADEIRPKNITIRIWQRTA